MQAMRCIDPIVTGWLKERMVRCGRPNCRCARGHLHGPYVYLTYRVWDERADRWRIKQRYVRAEDVLEVRRLLAENKAIRRTVRGMLRNQRRVLAGLERSRRQPGAAPVRRLQAALSAFKTILRERDDPSVMGGTAGLSSRAHATFEATRLDKPAVPPEPSFPMTGITGKGPS